MKVAVCTILVIFIGLVSGKNPGLKSRITQAGLTYAAQVAIDQLAKQAQGQRIPDQSGSSSGIHYEISNIIINSFQKPSSSITVTTDGLSWAANGLGLSISGHFHYHKGGFIPISDSGSIDVNVNSVNFNAGVSLGADSTGRPKIGSNGCSCNIGHVDVKFHGGAAFIYNLFKGKVADMLKSQLNGQLCVMIKKAIDTDAENSLAKLKVTVDIDKVFSLDYRFLGRPAFNPGHFLETYHKGEVYWASSTTDAPFEPAGMPQINSTGNMFYVWVSDYVFNTLSYQAQNHGMLSYVLTGKDLPAKDRSFLNTTCVGEPCIGEIIAAIGHKFPNDQVVLKMSSDFAPQMTVAKGKVNVNCGGTINMVTASNGTFLVALNASLQTSLLIDVKTEMIFASIKDMNLKLHVVKSNVGPLNDGMLNFIANTAILEFVKPQLNKLGAKGIPLPVTNQVHFVKTTLTLDKNTLMIATDLQYT